MADTERHKNKKLWKLGGEGGTSRSGWTPLDRGGRTHFIQTRTGWKTAPKTTTDSESGKRKRPRGKGRGGVEGTVVPILKGVAEAQNFQAGKREIEG